MINTDKGPFSWEREDKAIQSVFKKYGDRISDRQNRKSNGYVSSQDISGTSPSLNTKSSDIGDNDADNIESMGYSVPYTPFIDRGAEMYPGLNGDGERVVKFYSGGGTPASGSGPLKSDQGKRSYVEELRKSATQGLPISWKEPLVKKSQPLPQQPLAVSQPMVLPGASTPANAEYRNNTDGHSSTQNTGEAAQEKLSAPGSHAEPSGVPTVSSFLEGMKLFGQRFKNDFNYLVGKTGEVVNHEELLPGIIDSIEARGGALESLPLDIIERRIGDINRERAGIGYRHGFDDHSVTGGTDGYNAALSGEQSILSAVAQMKRGGAAPEQIREYINDVRQEGGPATQMMKDARATASSMPQATGWAKVGDIASSVALGAVPIAAGIAYPPLGIALGVGNVSSMMGQSVAEANIELDNHEEQTGERIPGWQRNIYSSTVAGVDMLLGGLMQSHYLKGVSAPLFNTLRKGMVSRVVTSEAAQKELGSLMRSSAVSALPAIGREVAGSAAMQGAASSASAVTRDIISMVYKNPEQYPTLTEILGDAFESGAAGVTTGAVLGGVRSVGGRAVQPLRRSMSGEVRLLDNEYGDTYEHLGTHPATGRYKVLDFNGRETYMNPADARDPRVMDAAAFREASKKPYSLALDLSRNGQEIMEFRPRPRLSYPDMLWLKDNSSADIVELKHYRVEDISGRVGVKPRIYNSIDDVPSSVRTGLPEGDNTATFYNPKTKEVGVIMGSVRSDADVESGLLRNGIANKGIRGILGDETDGFLDNVYEHIPVSQLDGYKDLRTKREKASAYLADLARDSDKNPSLWQQASQSVRAILRRNFGIGDIEDGDLRYIIWKAKNRIKRDDTIEEMRRKSIEENRMKMRVYQNGKRIR